MSHATAAHIAVQPVRLGLRENAAQFALLVVVNAFVGAMVGLERSILPAMATQEFQLAARTAGRTWLPVDLLRDAGVLALLRTGERTKARKLFISLARASTRGIKDLRTVVLQQLMVGR